MSKKRQSNGKEKSSKDKEKKDKSVEKSACCIKDCPRKGTRLLASLRDTYELKDSNSGRVCEGHYRSDLRSYKRKHDGIDLRVNKRKRVRKVETYDDSDYDSHETEEEENFSNVQHETDNGNDPDDNNTSGNRGKSRSTRRRLRENPPVKEHDSPDDDNDEEDDEEEYASGETHRTGSGGSRRIDTRYSSQRMKEEPEEPCEASFSVLDLSQETVTKILRFDQFCEAVLRHEDYTDGSMGDVNDHDQQQQVSSPHHITFLRTPSRNYQTELPLT